MKEIKVFFGNDNKLNKGYLKSSDDYNIDDKSLLQKKFAHILPPIDVVTEFENIYPGTLARIIDMAEKEQHHRHALELVMLEAQKRSIKIGRISAVLITLITCIATVILVTRGHHIAGITICSIVFTIIGITSYKPTKKSPNKSEIEKSINPQRVRTFQNNSISKNYGVKLNNNKNRKRIK